MSEIKTFTIKKTVPGSVLFTLSPMSNQALKKEIYLTSRMPQQVLPLDWALGIFLDNSVYSLYKQGIFTFNDNDGIVKAAQEAGVYFDETLDFTPVKEDVTLKILKVLKSGVRADILKTIKDYGDDLVKNVVIQYANDLTTGVIGMLENHWHIQLTMDGDTN
jgi:hypothetical protein